MQISSTAYVAYGSRLCENSARYNRTRNFEACGHAQGKKRRNSSSARRYDQIRFRFHTAWVRSGSADHLAGRLAHGRCTSVSGRAAALLLVDGLTHPWFAVTARRAPIPCAGTSGEHCHATGRGVTQGTTKVRRIDREASLAFRRPPADRAELDGAACSAAGTKHVEPGVPAGRPARRVG